MSRVDANAATATTTNTANDTFVGNSVEDLDLDVFLDLMLEELQNQDPLNPMDNSEMLNTISQIREISANDKLSETLESVLVGQNVATATSLIGTEVEGLTEDGRPVSGAVRRVSINDGAPMLDVAVQPKASAADRPGDLEPGQYGYEVVWENEDGTLFSVQVPVDTESIDGFDGAVRIENLPKTDPGVERRVYRTDSSGTGEQRLIGRLTNNNSAAFVDTFADDARQAEVLSGSRQVLRFADAVSVPLANVGRVQTLE